MFFLIVQERTIGPSEPSKLGPLECLLGNPMVVECLVISHHMKFPPIHTFPNIHTYKSSPETLAFTNIHSSRSSPDRSAFPNIHTCKSSPETLACTNIQSSRSSQDTSGFVKSKVKPGQHRSAGPLDSWRAHRVQCPSSAKVEFTHVVLLVV